MKRATWVVWALACTLAFAVAVERVGCSSGRLTTDGGTTYLNVGLSVTQRDPAKAAGSANIGGKSGLYHFLMYAPAVDVWTASTATEKRAVVKLGRHWFRDLSKPWPSGNTDAFALTEWVKPSTGLGHGGIRVYRWEDRALAGAVPVYQTSTTTPRDPAGLYRLFPLVAGGGALNIAP